MNIQQKNIISTLKKLTKNSNYRTFFIINGDIYYNDFNSIRIIINAGIKIENTSITTEELAKYYDFAMQPTTIRNNEIDMEGYNALTQKTIEAKNDLPNLLNWQDFKKVSECVSSDSSQYTLNGILIDNKNIVAVDGRRLALKPHNIKLNAEKSDNLPNGKVALIPSNCLSIDKLVNKTDYMLNFAIGTDQVLLSNDSFKMSVDTLSGKFPNYLMFMPENYREQENTFSANNKQLQDTLKKLKPYVSNDSYKLIFSNGDNRLKIEAQDTNMSLYASMIINKQFRIGLNVKLLVGMIKKQDKKSDVHFYFKDTLSPVTVKYSSDDDFTNIIMPMKLD